MNPIDRRSLAERQQRIAKILRRAATYPWTQKHLAVDIDGDETWPASPTAVRFCALGKIKRAAEDLYRLKAVHHHHIADIPEAEEAIRAFRDHLYPQEQSGSVTAWNDAEGRTREEVDRALLAAAEALKGD